MRRPPVAPPRHMLWAHLLKGKELARAFEREPADELRDRRRSQYADFMRTRLQRVPLDAVARVSLGFYRFCFLFAIMTL